MQSRWGLFVLWQGLNWMTKHCQAVLSLKEVVTLSRLPTPGYHSDNRSKLPHCPSPLCVLWGKGQVPGSSPPPHTLPRLEPWKRETEAHLLFHWGKSLDLNLLLQLGDCFLPLFFFWPAFLLLPIFMQKVISNKNVVHMMLPVGVHELLIAKGKHAVFKNWPCLW